MSRASLKNIFAGAGNPSRGSGFGKCRVGGPRRLSPVLAFNIGSRLKVQSSKLSRFGITDQDGRLCAQVGPGRFGHGLQSVLGLRRAKTLLTALNGVVLVTGETPNLVTESLIYRNVCPGWKAVAL